MEVDATISARTLTLSVESWARSPSQNARGRDRSLRASVTTCVSNFGRPTPSTLRCPLDRVGSLVDFHTGDHEPVRVSRNEALPRATEAVTREVSRRLTAGAAETREVEEESLCICCLDRPRDIVFLSCNHMVVCEQCAPRMASCPTCRVPITEKRRIFR